MNIIFYSIFEQGKIIRIGVIIISFQHILKHLRKSANLTQEEVAIKIGVARSNIPKYESGKLEPDNNTLIKLADTFDVTVDYLLGRTKNKQAIILDGDNLPVELKGYVEEIEVLKDAVKYGLSKEEIQIALEYAKKIKGIK